LKGRLGEDPLNHVHAFLNQFIQPSPNQWQQNPGQMPLPTWAAPEDEQTPTYQIVARLESEFNRLDFERIEGRVYASAQVALPGLTNDLVPRYPSYLYHAVRSQ
jgi:hypothetical protein